MKLDVSQSGGLLLDIDLDDIIPEELDNSVHYLVESTKEAVSSVIRHPDRSTGELVASVKAGKAKKVKGGGYYVPIVFPGTGSNGTRNGLKAAELEYGNAYQNATPFSDRAAHAAENDIARAVEDYIGRRLGE